MTGTTGTDWTVEEMCAEFGVSQTRAQRAVPAAPAPQAFKPSPLAEAVREMFRRERAARATLERRIESLERELATTRAELGVERRLAEALERLDRLEAASRAVPLRSVSG
jgi:hypothetical protein